MCTSHLWHAEWRLQQWTTVDNNGIQAQSMGQHAAAAVARGVATREGHAHDCICTQTTQLLRAGRPRQQQQAVAAAAAAPVLAVYARDGAVGTL